MDAYLWVALGAAGLWLGMPNALIQIPAAALAYPAALFLMGAGAAKAASPVGRAFRLGWLCGLLGASACLYWVAIPIHEIGGLPWLLAAPCALALGAYVGLYGGLFAALAAALARSRPDAAGGAVCGPWRRALILGLAWYLLEWFRGWFCSGFSWLSLASAFAPWPILIQGVSLIGVYGLGGLMVGLICLALEDAPFLRPPVLPRRPGGGDGEERETGRNRPSGVAAAGFALIIGFGFWRLLVLAGAGDSAVAPGGPEEASFPAAPVLALVQGDLDQNVKWDPAMQRFTVRRYLELSRKALDPAEGTAEETSRRPQVLIWPETAMPFDYRNGGNIPFPARIRAFARATGTAVLFGAPGFARLDPAAAARSGSEVATFNRAYLVSAAGADAGWYEKAHLVPFGEYMPPWLSLPFLRPLLQGVGDFTPGERVAPLPLPSPPPDPGDSKPAGRAHAAGLSVRDDGSVPLVLGVLICYETIFPELARQRVAEGASVLVNISNDAWFGRSAAPLQHLQLGLLRAVEQGRWLARATNTGISAFVDPAGRVVARGGLFVPESVAHAVVPLSGRTVFFHLAPWLPAVGLLLFAAAVLPLRRKKQPRGD